MLKASYIPHKFIFNSPGGTSRGILYQKPSWFIQIWDSDNPSKIGIGEVSIIPNLSPETEDVVRQTLNKFIANPKFYIDNFDNKFMNHPAIRFGIETALLDLKAKNKHILYPSKFTDGTDGIKINGLIWMGNKTQMTNRIKEKIEAGFNCLKLKIGAIDFQLEMELLKNIRKSFSADNLELRVDANGAFTPENALKKLEKISKYKIHSIEQPIKQNQRKQMAELCKKTPIAIALDEELIGINSNKQKELLINEIKPQYVIFKPSLIGGLEQTQQWVNIVKNKNIGWWITSALEGNIGLNAIAQWTFINGSIIPQGLGTGQVFSNNIKSPLHIISDNLYFNKKNIWGEI